MKVILVQDVKNLGKANDVVTVSDGYGKNFLLKTKAAVIYTKQSKIILDKNLQSLKNDECDKVTKAKSLKEKIEKVSLTFKLKTNKGKTFGEISHKTIIEKLNEDNGIKIDKYMFKNKDKILLGKQNISLVIYKNVEALLRINVEEEYDKKN